MKGLILIGIIFFFIQCRKDIPPPGLPAVTNQGKNTFGCKINGSTWIPYYDCRAFSGPTTALSFIVFRDSIGNYTWPLGFELLMQRASNTSTDYFKIETPFSLSPYPTYISHKGDIFDSLHITFQRGDCCDIYSTIPYYSPGSVNVTTLDTVNKIMSGTFSFNLYTYIGQVLDSVVVTEGRFDLKFDGTICY